MSAGAGAAGGEGGGEGEEGAGQDLEKVAEAVWRKIRHRLRVERERERGSS